MNNLLFWVEAKGLNSLIYDVFFVAGGVALILFCLLTAKNYKLPLKKALFVIHNRKTVIAFFKKQ